MADSRHCLLLHSILRSRLWLKGDAGGVNAVALTGRRGAVGEDVAEMSAAAGASHFDAAHSERLVFVHVNCSRLCIIKRWPTASRVKLGSRRKQRLPTSCTGITPIVFCVVILAGEGPLRALLTQDLILLRRQLLAPFLIGFCDCFHAQITTESLKEFSRKLLGTELVRTTYAKKSRKGRTQLWHDSKIAAAIFSAASQQ
jgi:hypothetical protein